MAIVAGTLLFFSLATASCTPGGPTPTPRSGGQILAPELGTTFHALPSDGGPAIDILVTGGERVPSRPDNGTDEITIWAIYQPAGPGAVVDATAWSATTANGSVVVGNPIVQRYVSDGRNAPATVVFAGLPSGHPVTNRYRSSGAEPFTMVVDP